MQTEQVGSVSANNFAAARVSKDLSNRSGVGVIAVNRVGTGALAGDNNWNRTLGVDGKWGIHEAVTLSAFAARTQTPGSSGREHAYSTAFEFRQRKYESTVSYAEVGEDFNPEVGFLERTDGYRQGNVTLPPPHPDAGAGEDSAARAGTARELRKLLGIRRASGNGHAARRQSLGFRERLLALIHGAQRPVRGAAERLRSVSRA